MESLRVDRFPNDAILDRTVQNLQYLLELHIVNSVPDDKEGALGEKRLYVDVSDGTRYLYIKLDDKWHEYVVGLQIVDSVPDDKEGALGEKRLYVDGSGTRHLYIKLDDGWHEVLML